MSSVQRKRDNSKIVSTTRIQRENIDPQWHIQNDQLQSQAQANSRLRQQIVHHFLQQTKQSYADSAIQADIKDKIALLKEKAVQLAQNLQGEKRKNIQLEAIIRHMVFLREEEKKIQATHRDDMNFQNLDNLSRKIKKSQYDLQQVFARLNDLTSKNKQRKNEVDTYRTQRVIDSGIFLKIQKQIVQYQTDYKKLLIEKTKFEQEYKKNLQNYKKMKADIERQQYISLSKRSSSNEKPDSRQQFFGNAPEIQHAVKFTQINNQQLKRKSFFGSKRALSTIQNKKEQLIQEMEYAVKKIFIETGISNVQDLVKNLEQIQQINSQLFSQVNNDTDKICNLKKDLSELLKKKSQKTIKYYQKEPQPTKTELKLLSSQSIEAELQKLSQTYTKTTQNLSSFLKIPELTQMLGLLSLPSPSSQSPLSLSQLFTKIQQNLTPIFASLSQYRTHSIQPSFSSTLLSVPISGPVPNNEHKQQSIDQLIGRVKRMQESEKIMGKEDFKREYEAVRRDRAKKRTTVVKK